MTSPVSIGDAFLIAKLALKLGRAFTAGRKSAPAEFREVESQLYSISTALSSLDAAYKSTGITVNVGGGRLGPLSREDQCNGENVLRNMLEGCEDTLKHLEKVVEKYTVISEPRNPEAPLLRKWSRDLRNNWKKVLWTTEGGDLSTLRSSLTVHINCLNLVLGVVNHTQTDRVETQIDQAEAMLREIYTWFVENLQGRTTEPVQIQRFDTRILAEAAVVSIRFKLYTESTDGHQLLCEHASLHPKWNQRSGEHFPRTAAGQAPLFQCNCSGEGLERPHLSIIGTIHSSPHTFTFRLTGASRSWMVYKAANRADSRVVSLLIKDVPASGIYEFEKSFIDVLGAAKARSMLRHNMGTMLAYTTVDRPDKIAEMRILHLLGDLQNIQNKVDNITFTIGRQSYQRTGIESIQLLHYQSLPQGHLVSDAVVYSEDLSQAAAAELVIFYGQDSSGTDVKQTIVHLTNKMAIRHQPGDSSVLLHKMDCTGLLSGDQESVIREVDVCIQLVSSEAATNFQKKMVEMRIELFVMSLSKPRQDERLALKLRAKEVHTERVDIASSEISIMQSQRTGRLRLVIVSDDRLTILSQELAEDFLRGSSGKPNFASPTYAVQIVGNGTREIHLYDKGFNFFEFSDTQMDRLFSLGLAAVSGVDAPVQMPRVN